MTIAERKRSLRREARLIEAREPGYIASCDGALRERFLALPEYRDAGSVMLYCSAGTEPGTGAIIARALADGKIVSLPRVAPDGTMRARRIANPGDIVPCALFPKIREPSLSCPEVALSELDLVLVPGAAFDVFNNRLGRGKGYYDRFLSGFDGVTVALARERFLRRDALPVDAYDVPIRILVTEERVLRR